MRRLLFVGSAALFGLLAGQSAIPAEAAAKCQVHATINSRTHKVTAWITPGPSKVKNHTFRLVSSNGDDIWARDLKGQVSAVTTNDNPYMVIAARGNTPCGQVSVSGGE